ncbi:MAG: AAA family ATPase [Deltaproteobacteria bacterium]|nr:AAA family ATPase [Deltaproteobacteria bacterium]
MDKSINYDAFKRAYNDFDPRELKGEDLKKFYVDELAKDSIGRIINTIDITERYRKILVIGHRGCGKTTILNKVAEELKNRYHVVFFSLTGVLGFYEVEPIDILLTTYLMVLESGKNRARFFAAALDAFGKMIEPLAQRLKIKEIGLDLFHVISARFTIESGSRQIIRNELGKQINKLQQNLSLACSDIAGQTKKEVLIIIDNIDKIAHQFAERIFIRESGLMTDPGVKIIYTLPLETFYQGAFNTVRERYSDEFIPPVPFKEIHPLCKEDLVPHLRTLVWRRIDKSLVTEDALETLIKLSGGLLRDLISYLQDACKVAILDKSPVIDPAVAKRVKARHVNEYYRLFDAPVYEEAVRSFLDAGKRIPNTLLTSLLNELFILEYRWCDDLWYDAHPCLK